MSQPDHSNDPFQDYAALLKTLLPEAVGCSCYDYGGSEFWADPPSQRVDYPADFDAQIRALLTDPFQAPAAPLHLNGRLRAYLLPLPGFQSDRHGVLCVLLENAGQLSADFCAAALEPLIRILRRELGLRFRLVDNQRKLRVQAAEENLLHAVESLVHQPEQSGNPLKQILNLCCSHLEITGARLSVPDRDIEISIAGSERRPAKRSQDETDDAIVMAVGKATVSGPGLLELSGWQDSAFSGRRRRRVARYIASHVETFIARDYDELTGLLAWPRFEAELEAACLSQSRLEHRLLFLDIDRLHVINENHGREIGDQVLTTFSHLLQEQMREHLCARITSDSFIVLLRNTGMDEAVKIAEQLCNSFHEISVTAGERQFNPSVCIGVAPLADDGKGASGSLATAQVACRAAKDRGRGRVECYRVEDQSIVRRLDDIQLVGNVREAILGDRLTLMAQPIQALKGKPENCYLEVLVRMLNEQGEAVAPKEFLSAAERYQLMEELDQWVVKRSLKLLADSGLNYPGAGIKLAINLSGQSLGSKNFLHFVEQTIKEARIPPSMLCFEITESVAVSNMQRAQSFMHALKRLGCQFSLDDFGTGLSSFAYLKLFPVDTLKIDGSFVRDVATNHVSQSVVAAISEVARVMELDTVAEYVQNEESMNLLRDLGITWGQGYYIGEPRPLESGLKNWQKIRDSAKHVDAKNA